MDSFCGSSFWNISLTWNTEDPDFTECFQNTIFVWVPVAFLWIWSPLEIYNINNSTSKPCPWSWKNISKLLITIFLLAITAADLGLGIYWKNNSTIHPVDYVTPIIKILTFLLTGIFIILNKNKGIHSSGVLFLFWFLMAFFGAIKYRSLFRHPYLFDDTSNWFSISYIYVFYPLVVVMFVIHIFVDDIFKEKKKKSDQKDCPEGKASFISTLFFTWFDSMAWYGYRNPLETKDLWYLNPCDSSTFVVPKFENEWKRSLKRKSEKQEKTSFDRKTGRVDFKESKQKKNMVSILGPLWRVFAPTFLFGFFCKLIQDLLTFVQPQILDLLIGFIDNNEELWKGYFYAVLMFITAATQSLFLAQYFLKMNIIAIRIRTSLISAIYKKSLRLSSTSRKESTVGEIVNLMSVDAQRFVDLMPNINLLWSAPLQIILSLYFLWNILGVAVLSGLAVMIILIPLNGWIATKIRSLQIRQMKFKDERVKLMNEILSGIKVLKLYAWEPSFENIILKIRLKEEEVLKKTAYLSATTQFFFSSAPLIVALFSFITYIYMDENNFLDAKIAFVSLSLFNILRFPLTMFPMLISYLVQTFVSIGRINTFLNFDEIDPNNISNDSNDSDPVVIENGFFSWQDDEKIPTLRNINLRVTKGNLVTVIGAVASGKSSIVSALLGEMQKISGRVNILGSVAYVPQQAWIQNATLQDNILFGKKYDSKLYSEVIEACALEQDLAMLPAGDKTEIGEKGINLSGGQKQRVSLARAVYNDADLYFLDDPLSAVDSHVGKHIFEKVIGSSGMLKNKTRILITHGISYLPNADQIYVIKDGEISETGSYKQLLEKKGAFAEFLLEHLNEVEIDDPMNELNEIKQQLEKVIDSSELKTSLIRMVSIISEISEKSQDGNSMRGSFRRGSSIRSSTNSKSSRNLSSSKKIDTKQGEILIEDEKAQTGNIKWKTFKYYLVSAGLIMLLSTITFNIFSQVFSIGSNVWLSYWANSNTTKKSDQDYFIGIYGALGAGQVITVIPGNLALALGSLYASSRLHKTMLNRTLHNPTSFFDTTPIGRLINRYSKDVDILDNVININIRSWIMCFISVIGTLAIISYNYVLFLAVIAPTAIVYYLIQRFYVATSRQLKRIESITRSPIYSHFSETITGASVIRAYRVQERFSKESEDKVDFNQMCYYPNVIANRWLAVRLEMIGNMLIFFASLFVVLSHDLDSGKVGLTVSYALSITQTLNWLVRMTSDVETNIVAVERIKEYGETIQEAEWNIQKTAPPDNWPSEGHVEFDNFSVRYREGLDLVLKNLSFKIQGGEKVGIVGRTGAGKSSLTLSLFRLIEGAGGAIYIDNIDISKIGLHQLRSKLTIIPQDPVLFSGSLRMNLDPFSSFDDEKIWRALEHAHLLDYAKNLPAGLHHLISEGGDNLSVGQRQLVCLARALLRKTKVLILDEATAAVDLETDDLIQSTIRKEFKDCTVLTIAHRLNTILDSDRVLVLDKGILKEFDKPQQLLENQQSIFYGMAKDAGIV